MSDPDAFPDNPAAPKHTRPCRKPADPNRLPFPVDAYGTHIRADRPAQQTAQWTAQQTAQWTAQ